MGCRSGAASNPAEFAPTSQQQLQWPKWGQHHQNRGRTGEPCDGPYATELLAPHGEWIEALAPGRRAAIWRRMLDVHADAQLCADDPDFLDREQGIPHLKGIPCTVRPAAA